MKPLQTMRRNGILPKTTATLWGPWRLVALLSLLLAGLPAQAADYIFSATSTTFPAGCSYVSAGSYTCPILTLVAGDTVTMEPNAPANPATIKVGGTFVATGASVNVGGLASNLNIEVVGTVAVTSTRVNANVSSVAAIDINPGSVIGGNLSATTTTGIITLFTNAIIEGNISTTDGAVTVGVGGKVLGSLTTVAGAVTLGTSASVGGDVTTGAGAITVGDGGAVGGSVRSTGAGVVTLGFDVTVAGNVITQDGGITVGGRSKVLGSVTSPVGVVTLGASASVSGDVITVTGAINIGDASAVGRHVRSTGAGVVTLGLNVTVAGDLSTDAGAITVGGGSSVCGNLGSTGAGIVTLSTNVSVGGGVNTVAGAITIGAGSTVQKSILITGAGVMTLTSVKVGGDLFTLTGAITATTTLVRGTVTQSNVLTYPTWANQAGLVVPSSASCTARASKSRIIYRRENY